MLSLIFAALVVKNALSRANKKTAMLIGFIGLHTENGGNFAHRDLDHKDSGQWTVNSGQSAVEKVRK
jgi:hypothetical protein